MEHLPFLEDLEVKIKPFHKAFVVIDKNTIILITCLIALVGRMVPNIMILRW